MASRCLALAVAVLSSGLLTLAPAQRKADPTRILNNMFRVYSRLASYQDEGILVTTNDEETGGTIEKMPFKTFFERPNLFRFEWTDYGIMKLGKTRVLWFDGKEAFTYWEPDRYEKEESLSFAAAGATGVSYGTVRTVLELLLTEEFGGSRLKMLVKVSLLGEEMFEGVRCYRLKATDSGDPIELWIGKNDFLLRKLRQERKYDDRLSIREEIRRKISVDQSIPEVVFNYKPPIALTPREDINPEDIDKLLNPGPPVWTEFRSEGGGFTISMPDKPTTHAATIETPQGRFVQQAFIASHYPIFCLVAYTDVPKGLLVAKNVDGFFDGVRDQFIREVGGKLASESSVSLDGHPGRDIKVHMFRSELRLRLFFVGDRLYQISINNLEKDLDEETIKKFFASFKLNTMIKPIARQEPGPRDAGEAIRF